MKEIGRQNYVDRIASKRKNGLIKVITGLRRSGKSYLLFELYYRRLIQDGVRERNVVKFSFDVDEDIDKLDVYFPEESTRIKEKGKNVYKINSKKFRAYINDQIEGDEDYYLLLDEIQNLDNFAGTLNGFLRKKNLDVYVTGSNSHFLSSDILTEFRGRGEQIHVYPLTFKEFYDYRGLPFDEAYKEYSYYGGMPLTLNYEKDEDKASYLKSLYDEVYLKDLVDRNSIADAAIFSKLIDVVASSIGSYTNSSKLERTFQSGLNLTYSHVTIEKHLGYLMDAFLLSKATRYDIKGKNYIQAKYKYYFTDVGLRNAKLNFRQFEPSHTMENIIYNELLARGFSVDIGIVEVSELNAKGVSVRKDLEVDFVINKNDLRVYIQSAYAIPDEEKARQEKRSLSLTGDSFRKIIVVADNIKSHRDEDGVEIVSLKDFLLGEVEL